MRKRLVRNLATTFFLLLATPAFGQVKEFFVYQGTPDQQTRLRAALEKIKFPWDRLLPGMQANKYYRLVSVPEIDGVPGGDPIPNPVTYARADYRLTKSTDDLVVKQSLLPVLPETRRQKEDG